MTEYLTQEDLIKIHDAVIDPKGHELGVMNWGILYMVPYKAKGKELFESTAIILHGVSEGQPFLDSNRRVSLVAAYVLLRMNGHKLKIRKLDCKKFMTEIKDGLEDIEGIKDQ